MPLDPQIADMLAFLAAAQPQPMSQQGAAASRAQFRTLTVDLRDPASVTPVGDVRTVTVAGAAGELPARVYVPDSGAAAAALAAGTGPTLPTLVYFHGGGFVIGDLDTHDATCRLLCAQLPAVVVSVDYRLAPEHRWPAAADDAVAATRWVFDHVADFGGDAARVAVGGDSAGGNLAAVVALALRDAGGPLPAAQLLLYPATDALADGPSRHANADGFFLTADDIAWFGAQYLGDIDDPAAAAADWRLSPARAADHSGLPAAVVATAEYDPLRDEGDAYAELLRAAGVAVRHTCYPGMVHGFFDLGAVSPGAAVAVTAICADLAALLR